MTAAGEIEMNEQTARELVVRAGRELMHSGLIARTWGNVSCRTERGTFAVTPSGRSYETLQPEHIVLCRIDDCSYSGSIKPSSEKRIHALLYQTYPEISFIIHTHQNRASAVSAAVTGNMPSKGYRMLGDSVPVAAYGLPGTKKLTHGVAAALKPCSGNAVILSHHGAVCFGKTYEEAFLAAKQLEAACFEFVCAAYSDRYGTVNGGEQEITDAYVSFSRGAPAAALAQPVSLGCSRRNRDGFTLLTDRETAFRFGEKLETGAAGIHQAIYQNRPDINVIRHSEDPRLLAVSRAGLPLRPWLDDFAQIVGRNALCAAGAGPKQVVAALRGRKGVLVPDSGALCCAATEDDAHALELVMIKDALAQIGTRLIGSGRAIGLADCLLMNYVYNKSYSKKAKTQL
jgi:L-fuculose-phosphate aldolase